MVNLFHNFDLSFDTFPPIWLKQLELLINLDSDLLIQHFVKSNSDNCISSLAYSFTNDVAIDVFNVAAISTELIVLTIESRSLILSLLILLNVIS